MSDGERINTILRCCVFITFVIASFFSVVEAFLFFCSSFMIVSLIFSKVEIVNQTKLD